MILPIECKYCGSKAIEFLPNMRIHCLECLAEYDDDPDEDVDWEEFRRNLQKKRDETLEKITMEMLKNL